MACPVYPSAYLLADSGGPVSEPTLRPKVFTIGPGSQPAQSKIGTMKCAGK